MALIQCLTRFISDFAGGMVKSEELRGKDIRRGFIDIQSNKGGLRAVCDHSEVFRCEVYLSSSCSE